MPSSTSTPKFEKLYENLRPDLEGITTITKYLYFLRYAFLHYENLRPDLEGITTRSLRFLRLFGFSLHENLRPDLEGITTISSPAQALYIWIVSSMRTCDLI